MSLEEQRAREARSRELSAAGDYIRAINETHGPWGRSASETASALAREEARLIVLGNFATVGFLFTQRAEASFPASNIWFGIGVILLLVGALASVLALRFWATSLSHEAAANFLTIRREQARVSFDLYGTTETKPVTDADIDAARKKQNDFRDLGYKGMAAAGALSIFGYASFLKAFEHWLGFVS
jgi:hypothetical protein